MKFYNELNTIQDKKDDEKEKLKRRKNKRHVKKMDLKFLLKGKTLKRIKQEKYTDLLDASFGDLEKEIGKYYQGKSKIIDDEQTLVELITNRKFAKALITIMLDRDELSKIVFFAISDLYIHKNKALLNDVKLTKNYLKLYKNFAAKDMKKLKKKLSLSKDNKKDAFYLYLYGFGYRNAKFKNMRQRYKAFSLKLNDIEDLTVSGAMYAIKHCLGKNCNQFLGYALGERDTKSENFAVITDAVLKILNGMDNSDRKDIIKQFAKNRSRNPKFSIRTDLTNTEYNKINKSVERLIDTGMDADLFK